MNNKNSDEKYKEKESQHQHAHESVINKIKEEEALIKLLISMSFQQKVIHYMIDIVTLC